MWLSAKSAWELFRSCHRTSANQPLFTSLEIPWGFFTQAVLRYLVEAYVMQESESLRIFVSKKGMIRDHPTDVHMRNLQQKAESGNTAGSESTTRFWWASYFKKSMRSVPETWGCTYDVLPQSAKGMRKQNEKSDSRAAIKGAKKLLSSDSAKTLE